MMERRYSCKAVCLNDEIYVFGGCNADRIWNLSVEKYDPVTKSWIKKTNMPDCREGYRVCGFMDKIFIIGGYYRDDGTDTTFCLQFDTKAKNRNWKKVTGMNETRSNAACVVYEGRIVVSGGYSDVVSDYSNTVEVYDVFGNEWSFMPNMTRSRRFHKMVVVKHKLFVIGHGTNSCEVYDNNSTKFVVLKSKQFIGYHQAVSIGEKIYVFTENLHPIHAYRSNLLMVCYDVSTDEWSQKSCEAVENSVAFCCVKLLSY